MGQIKNIKLHIVTDIKILKPNQSNKMMKFTTLIVSAVALIVLFTMCVQAADTTPKAATTAGPTAGPATTKTSSAMSVSSASVLVLVLPAGVAGILQQLL